jgi:hypothetical protein
VQRQRRRAERSDGSRRRGCARRYEQLNSWAYGGLLLGQGKAAEAVESLRQAVISAKGSGIAFAGAAIHGRLARALSEPDARRRELAHGEEIILRGCVGHNQLHFYPEAIDVCLELSDWDEADRYAEALERFARAEPMAWSSFFARRGQVLAAIGRGRQDAGLVADLSQLLEQAETFGYLVAAPRLRAALREARAAAGAA